MNTRFDYEEIIFGGRWIFTDSPTGKTELDTHYSFFNKNAQACVEDYNDILIEDDIMKTVSVNEEISGITAVIIDAVNLFGKKSLEKINFKIKTGAQ